MNYSNETPEDKATRMLGNVACTQCKGDGGKFEHAFRKFPAGGTDKDGKIVAVGEFSHEREVSWKDCYCCNGRGTFPALDSASVDAVLAMIVSSQGPSKGKLKSSRPKYVARDITANRAYFVWRLARFHAGVDCTLPIMADGDVRGDGEKPTLEVMSRLVATRLLGSDEAGTYRWRRALLGDAEQPYRADLDPLRRLGL